MMVDEVKESQGLLESSNLDSKTTEAGKEAPEHCQPEAPAHIIVTRQKQNLDNTPKEDLPKAIDKWVSGCLSAVRKPRSCLDFPRTWTFQTT